MNRFENLQRTPDWRFVALKTKRGRSGSVLQRRVAEEVPRVGARETVADHAGEERTEQNRRDVDRPSREAAYRLDDRREELACATPPPRRAEARPAEAERLAVIEPPDTPTRDRSVRGTRARSGATASPGGRASRGSRPPKGRGRFLAGPSGRRRRRSRDRLAASARALPREPQAARVRLRHAAGLLSGAAARCENAVKPATTCLPTTGLMIRSGCGRVKATALAPRRRRRWTGGVCVVARSDDLGKARSHACPARHLEDDYWNREMPCSRSTRTRP